MYGIACMACMACFQQPGHLLTALMMVPFAGSEAAPDPLPPPGAALESRPAVSEVVLPVPMVSVTGGLYEMC